MNTILTIETEYCKNIKELKPTDVDDYETCDSVIREFLSLMVSAGWMPGSIKEATIDIAEEYKNSVAEII